MLQTKIIAHRGAWEGFRVRQNTLISIKRAIDLGCDGVEVDLRRLVDNTIVLHHDATHGEDILLKKDWAWSIRENLATLEDLLDMIGKTDVAKKFVLDLEIKESGTAVYAHEALKEYSGNYFISSFSSQILEEVKTSWGQSCPKLGLIQRGKFGFKKPAYDYLISTALGIGSDKRRCILWDVNYPDQIRKVLGAKVAGIITDNPEIAIKIREELK